MSGGAFLGTSAFAVTVLELLAASDQRPSLVVTLPDRRQGRGRKETPSPVAIKAGELGIELLKSGNVNEDEDRARIAAASAAPGWASICAFGQLIREPLLAEVPMLNVHPSLLPRWRGAAPVERAIMSGDTEIGVSVMRLVEGLDSGPVALVERSPIGPDEDYGSLADRLARIGGRLLIEALTGVASGTVDWTEQTEAGLTYAEKIGSGERRIDPDRTATEIHDQVRALHPHIGAWLSLNEGSPEESRLGIKQVSIVEMAEEADATGSEGSPAGGHVLPAVGQLVERDGQPLLGCSDGALRLDLVQPPGKTAMDGASWLRGHGLS